jgi:peptidoglycan-associated lipoprotein
MLSKNILLGFALGLPLTFSACSKKEVKQDGDASGADTAMQPTDMGTGAPIPELPAVYFAYDSFQLTSDSKAALTKHAEWLKANTGKLVQIEGHTDERGTTEYNLALGERRAGAVRDFLAARGVSAGQISTISYGEERPSVSGESESAWSKNRRAEFVSGGR